MHHAVIDLVDSETGRLLDVADLARVIDAGLSGLEATNNVAAHENALADRIVGCLHEYRAIWTV
jgi:hypothetical protein